MKQIPHRISHLRKRVLLGQSLTYLSVGIFLLAYVKDVRDTYLISTVAILLCLWSFTVLVIVNLSLKFAKKIFSFNFDEVLIPIVFASLIIGVATTVDKQFLFLRFVLPLGWVILKYFFDIVDLVNALRSKVNIRNLTRSRIYRISVVLEYMSTGMGFFLLINKMLNPDTALSLIALDEYLYNPIVWFGIGLLFLFPIIALTPSDSEG